MLSLTLPSITRAKSREVPARPRFTRRRTTTNTQTTTPKLGVEHLFVHAGDAVVVEDIGTRHIVEWNPAAERLFGYTAPQAVGRPVDMLMPAPVARMVAHEAAARPRRVALMARVVEGRTAAVQCTSALLADSAAIQTGTFALSNERVNLVPLVGQVVAAARARWNLHRVKLGAPQGLTASGDAARIEQVLNDLIDRAVRRNPHGCWIDVDLRRPLAGVARIEVRDYGRRLSDRERSALPHSATPDRGWYVARHIVEQHGGTLAVEFPDEGGARVIVTLPTNGGRVAA